MRSGRPDLEIVEAARDTSPDLIGRLLFGSVAEQVLRRADVPVFMMRQSEERAPATATTLERRAAPYSKR